ncbi:MAG TPA: hypothetical protein VFM37_02220 [Pseudonocardiaceae bacterium]|nr:hypothetical protein [Pseudonocardiaceae bacterium]
MSVRWWLVLAAAVVAVAAATAYAGPVRESRAANPSQEPRAVLIDADEYGAIVIDGRERAAFGVNRDGSVAWRSDLQPTSPVPVSCLERCPDAVLSGSAASINSDDVADPDPVAIIDGRRRDLARPAGGGSQAAAVKRQVLAARTADDYLLATVDGAGRAQLVEYRSGALHRVPVGGTRTTWATDASSRHALAVTTIAAGRGQARWFDRTADGWRPAGPAIPVAGSGSCVAPGGRQAILLGQRPQLIDRHGGLVPLSGLNTAGTCAFAATGGIVGELLARPEGPRSRLRAFDSAGATTWAVDVAEAARVTADPARSRVAFVAGGKLRELDPRTGAELRTIPGTRAARYVGGSLVVVTTAAAPVPALAWLD